MERKGFLGGTDMAAIMGFHPYKSALAVYTEKIGMTDPFEGNESTWLGEQLEPAMIQWYKDVTDTIVEQVPDVVHPEYPFFKGHPDGIVHMRKDPVGKASKVLEVKTVGWRSAHNWGNAYTDEIPSEYLIQSAFYMMLTGLPTCDFAAAFIQDRKEIFTVERSDSLEVQMIEAGITFWENHVEKQVPPEVGDNAPKSQNEALARLFPITKKPMLPATKEAEIFARGLCDTQKEIKRLKAEEEKYKAQIKSIIGDAKGIQGSFGKINWQDTTGSTSWKAVAHDLADQYGVPKDVLDFTLEKHRKDNYRTLKPYWSK